MKPLQKITTIKSIYKNLKDRGLNDDEIYHYLKCYNPDVVHPDYCSWSTFDEYCLHCLVDLEDDVIMTILNEIRGEIIPVENIEKNLVNSENWRSGYFRIFISHLTENKDSAAKLKVKLEKYGIDCFVAHEDIEPSKLWQTEIEKALASMDLLCAILTPDFYKSKWCDQEIGIALGRAIPTISIKKGADPHGFIGKYQAIKAKEKVREVAKDVFDTICKMDIINHKYFSLLLTLFLNSKNEQEALDWLRLINGISNFNVNNVDKLTSLYDKNSILKSEAIIKEYNKLAKKIGTSEKEYSKSEENYIDLPF